MTMRAQINGIFCGDDSVSYEGKNYRRLFVFSKDDHGLYKVAVPSNLKIDDLIEYEGRPCSVLAELRTFEGRNRLRLISIDFV